METTYVIYQMLRCSEETRIEGDLECHDDTIIEPWLADKSIHLRVLNEKIDFAIGN